ncbi:GxxExxY protein [Coleofasciculus sp. E2-BRE-01]|uniref:GxxExxY protein n=1 Tax=Coleofasciculus sp. E2-BRE-01 TaxID=3069524 RepID=UPI003300A266
MGYLYEEKTYQIIGAAQEVHRELGAGFLEVVYQDSLEIEFHQQHIPNHRECPLPIFYKGVRLNRTYNADFLCFDQIIVETKAVRMLVKEFEAQTLNYLKATKLRLGLLINFGEPSLKVKRIIN